jgi:hypothetical protein
MKKILIENINQNIFYSDYKAQHTPQKLQHVHINNKQQREEITRNTKKIYTTKFRLSQHPNSKRIIRN